MAKPCGCKDTTEAVAAAAVVAAATPALCPATVHETVCVQADVTIVPNVVVGEVSSTCVNGPIIGQCSGELVDSCTFSVSQQICVQVPLTFSATATATPKGLVCGVPATGNCPV
ncbi:MAG: hypothetical protein Q8865_04940 [Bacillota bacterium]|nr:hypothetical protein [Bacillota bacterium]